MKVNTINIEAYIRLSFFFFFSLLYLYRLFGAVYVSVEDLGSDSINYYEFYRSSDTDLYRWGVEVLTPVLFFVAKVCGLSYFDLVFLVGLAWLIPIHLISKRVRLQYLVLYYAFFLVWFAVNYGFLFRQYLASYFIFLYFFVGRKVRYVFLLLSFLSHISVVIIMIFSYARFNSRILYVLTALFVVIVFVMYGFGLSFLTSLSEFTVTTGFADIDRKLSVLQGLNNEFSTGSASVYFVLCVSIILHSFSIDLDGERFSLERAFYFSAVLSLLLSENVVLSNRVGFLSYFFSIPYILIVASHFRMRISKRRASYDL